MRNESCKPNYDELLEHSSICVIFQKNKEQSNFLFKEQLQATNETNQLTVLLKSKCSQVWQLFYMASERDVNLWSLVLYSTGSVA